MEKIFELLYTAKTTTEITDILEILTDDFDISWRAVGDKLNNESIVNIGTNPASAIVERITNAIDSVLELQYRLENCPQDILSPREAALKWFNIPDGRLKNIKDPSEKTIQHLAKKVHVTLKDSEREDFPTVEIRDYGTGVAAKDFSKTILSLNDSNKVEKFYQIGAYGQGGGSSLSFSNFTVIISRPHKILKKGAEVAFTIVRFNNGGMGKRKLGWYEYCVGKDNIPLSFKLPVDMFEPGTLIKHIGMDVKKYSVKLTSPTNSLWYLTNHYMFDTVLPFTISGQRKKDLSNGKKENRTILGNNRRLSLGGGEGKSLTEYQNSHSVTFKEGKAIINYWVLGVDGEKPWNRIRNYTLPSESIIITLNGQKHGSLSSSIVKRDLNLPFLEKYLIVQIECDQMDNTTKRLLFSSTRENTRDTSIKKDVIKLLLDILSEDAYLKVLNKERKNLYLKKDTLIGIDKLRDNLALRVNASLKKIDTKQKGLKVISTSDAVKKRSDTVIPINDAPTFLDITSEKDKPVFIGKTFFIKFKTDAHPHLFVNPDNFSAVIEPHSFGSYTGSVRIVDGYGIVYFKVRESVESNTQATVSLNLRVSDDNIIGSKIGVIAYHDSSKKTKKTLGNKTFNIDILDINENDDYYKENDWNYQTVADVVPDSENIVVYINNSNSSLTKLIEKGQKNDSIFIETIKNHYREHIGFCAVMMLYKNKDMNVNDPSSIKLKNSYLEVCCESICEILSRFSHYILTE